jgi:hypothetical protein
MKKTKVAIMILLLLAMFSTGYSVRYFTTPEPEKIDYDAALDYKASLYRAELISAGERVVNVTKPEGIQLMLEVNDWRAFRIFHAGYANGSVYCYFEEPTVNGHIPTFYFLYIAESYNWIMMFRVFE